MKMSFKGWNVLPTLLIIGGVIFFAACERDYNTIGVDLIDNGDIQASKKAFDVYAYNKKLKSVRTNGLSAYQLGGYEHPVYGVQKSAFAAQLVLQTANPTFGSNTQATEDSSADEKENERVTAVYLNIPFFSTALSDTTNLAEKNPKPYRVDSIFGNRSAQFTLKVQEFTKYLRDFDPASNFQQSQEYFSDEDGVSFATTVLHEDTYEINERETVIIDTTIVDDADTAKDESVVERLTPRIRVELDKEFFQEKILDNEGNVVLANQDNFKDFLRGLYVSVDMPNNDLAMFLNIQSSYVEIQYDYDVITDGVPTTESKTYKLNMSGNKINYLTQNSYPSTVLDQFNGANASRLYPNGGAGSYIELDILAGKSDVATAFQEAKEKGWLINEANLIFYVDEASLPEKSDVTLPKRLYLYNRVTDRSLADYKTDTISTGGATITVDSLRLATHGGYLKKDDELGYYYKFRITNYIANLLRDDSTVTEAKLGLVTTSLVYNTWTVSAFNETEELKIPQASIPNLYGTILYGNSAPESDKKLKLEIYYTETTGD